MIETRFKKTEVGEIPEDWEVKALGEVCTFEDSKRIPIKESERANMSGIYPYYGASGIIDHINKYIFDGDYILLGEDGANIVDRSSRLAFIVRGKCWINNHAHVIKPGSGINIYYLSEYLESLSYESYNTGTAQPKLNRKKCNNIPVACPPFLEQQRIATALSDIDALLSALNRKIEKKKLIKQGAMQQLLTGKKRLAGFTEPWEEKRLGTGLRFKPGFPFNSNNFSNSTGVRLIRNRDLKTDDQVIYYSGSYSHDYIINNGDLLIGMDGDFLPCLWSKGFALLNQRVGKIEIVNPDWNVTFLYYHLIEPLMKKQEGTGATTVKHLSHTDIESFILKLPPSLKEQSAIATILSDMDKEIEALEAKRTKYKQVKQGMTQQLLTGKIRLIDHF